MQKTLRRGAVAALTTSAVVALAACGSSTGGGTGATAGSSNGASAAASKGTVVVGSANFPENELIADMYVGALKADGYTVTTKLNIGNREVYYAALGKGEVDVVPEYVGTLTEFLNAKVNGTDAAANKPLASTDPAATLTALTTIAAGVNLVPSAISPAQDQNSFAVTKDFATKNSLTSLSDLTKLNGQITLGGPPECPQRPFCEVGLQKTYGLSFKGFTSLDAGGPLTIAALTGNQVQLGLVFSSDGAIAANNLVVLKDDKSLQQADNIVGIATKAKATPELLGVLNKVNAALTTEKLQTLNKQISIDKSDPADVAATFLKSAGITK